MVGEELNVLTSFSGARQALRDLGYRDPMWVDGLSPNAYLSSLSPERVELLRGALVVFIADYSAADDSDAAVRARLDRTVPGWREALARTRLLCSRGRRICCPRFTLPPPQPSSCSTRAWRTDSGRCCQPEQDRLFRVGQVRLQHL